MHKDKEAPRQQQLKTKVGNLVKYRFFVIAIISGAFSKKKKKVYLPGLRIRIRLDPLIFGPPDTDPVLLSTDPDPTYNNGL